MGKVWWILFVVLIFILGFFIYFFMTNYYYPKLVFSNEISVLSCNDPDGSNLLLKSGAEYSYNDPDGSLSEAKSPDYCEFYMGNVGGKNIDQRKGLIREGVCKNNKFINQYWTCGWGKVCRNGACIKADKSSSICTDSDNGKNTKVKGDIFGYGGVGDDSCYVYIQGSEIDGTLNEECFGDNCYVWEWYCDSDSKAYEIIPCPQGCSQGACK